MNRHTIWSAIRKSAIVLALTLSAAVPQLVLNAGQARAQSEPVAPAPSSPTATAPAPTATAPAATATAQTIDVAVFMADPVLHGAWLWQANCVRCHGQYGDERVGDGLKKKELVDKIADGGRESCAVAWSITNGGPLSIAEIKDIAAYIGAWEEVRTEPNLAPLLPIPQPTARPAPTMAATPARVLPTATPSINADIAAALALSPVYESARQSSTLDDEQVRALITNGKVASIMPKFGLLNGGNLRRAQVDAIVAYMRTWEELGGAPELPPIIAAELAQRTQIALAMPTMVGAPPAFTVAPAPARAVQAQSVGSAQYDGLWDIFMLLTAMAVVGGAGLFLAAVACTAINPPKRDAGQ
jgi:mono/diheme cytochrome c family protein